MDAYKQYKLQWMIEHGYSLEDLIQNLADVAEENLSNDGQYSFATTLDNAFDIFEKEVGFRSGEIWACEDEFNRNDCEEKILIKRKTNTNGQIIDLLSLEEQDAIYRHLWAQRVQEDVRHQLDELNVTLSDDQIFRIAARYVYDGAYDCNLSYWSNIRNLIHDIQCNQ